MSPSTIRCAALAFLLVTGAAGCGVQSGPGEVPEPPTSRPEDGNEPRVSADEVAEPRSSWISRPGEYAGYSTERYDGHERTSFYVPMRDGTRLAMDLFRPTRSAVVESDPLPVVWMHTPYNRRTFRGELAVERYPGYAARLIPHGYIVAVVDFRGLYASFGENGAYNRGEWLPAARMDAYDVTEWLADQPWSSGRIGMWGCSATGGSQMQAASTAPPSLKAIFPMSCEFDVYPFAVRGGVSELRGGTTRPPGGGAASAVRDRSAVPVDGPEGEELLAEAVAEHANNIETSGFVPYRDSRSVPLDGVQWWLQSSPHSYLGTLRDSGIGVYTAANWDEAGTKHGAAFTFKNLEPRAKLIFGPATHCDWTTVLQTTGFDIVVEELRFFDYWLKGIENGVMEEPAVTYYTYNAPEGDVWRTASTWPLPNEVRTDFYLVHGRLTEDRPTSAGRTPASLGEAPTVSSTAVEVTDGGVVFETAPLEQSVEVTGHPVVSLWIEADVREVDVFAALEDVAPDGTVTSYQVNGQIRASHRALAEAPYDNLGLPWHSHRDADEDPLSRGEPAELVFGLLPISYIFPEGHRARLRIQVVDPAGEETGRGAVDVLHSADHPSSVTLPIIPS